MSSLFRVVEFFDIGPSKARFSLDVPIDPDGAWCDDWDGIIQRELKSRLGYTPCIRIDGENGRGDVSGKIEDLTSYPDWDAVPRAGYFTFVTLWMTLTPKERIAEELLDEIEDHLRWDEEAEKESRDQP